MCEALHAQDPGRALRAQPSHPAARTAQGKARVGTQAASPATRPSNARRPGPRGARARLPTHPPLRVSSLPARKGGRAAASPPLRPSLTSCAGGPGSCPGGPTGAPGARPAQGGQAAGPAAASRAPAPPQPPPPPWRLGASASGAQELY